MIKFKLISIILLFSLMGNAQYKIMGKITDKQGNPLTGASLQFKNLPIGTISDGEGNFVFNNLKPGSYVLLASYIGYKKAVQEISLTKNTTINFQLKIKSTLTEEIIVASTRASKNTPTTYTTVDKEAIEAQNLGQDIPFMLSMEPSVVTTSDAGAGIGYTGMWIRGSNIQRINVTVNGIPLNDPESHGVFWVNMPDFSSSVNSIQVQRGVGTSTNGGGAFGATINLETNTVEHDAFGEINSSLGSFNTYKNNARFGTGLINDKWAFEGRLSAISSDGYVDRASSDLKSYFLQGGYYTDNTTVKAVVFSGKEKTYQAWWGVDQYTMDNLGRTYNWAGAIFDEDGNTHFYDNQTDNYQQDHYQLHFSHKFSDALNINAALHYTYGRGYYEEYNQNADLSAFGINNFYYNLDTSTHIYNDTIQNSDLITRRWLDNHFYGITYSANYHWAKINLIFGGATNKYANAKHFGEVIWTKFAPTSNNNQQYYNNVSNKTAINNYIKANYQLSKSLNLFADFQARYIAYTGEGTDSDGSLIAIDKTYFFFNPKGGFSYVIQNVGTIYGSAALSQREPIRTDFLDAPDGRSPEPEKLMDYELGMRKKSDNWFYNINVYVMNYSNQLALTGEINDVGSPIRTNTGKSNRTGVEFDAGIQPTQWLAGRANLALSNSNTDFKTIVFDETDTTVVTYNDVPLSFSPKAILGAEISLFPIKNAEICFNTKYISKQYMDLTQNEDHRLDPYITSKLRMNYKIHPKFMKEINLSLLVNNFFNLEYATNGYMWGIPYYYPQATRNFLAGISLKF